MRSIVPLSVPLVFATSLLAQQTQLVRGKVEDFPMTNRFILCRRDPAGRPPEAAGHARRAILRASPLCRLSMPAARRRASS
jgi:hypothetical protein